jgi:hypothetical protein
MKRFFTFLILALVVFGAVESRAAILLGGLTTVVTAQTNTTTFQTNTAYLSIPQVTVSNGGLSTNTAYSGFFRFSIDNGTTWFTNNSPNFTPTSTNSASYPIAAQTIQVPIQVQMLAITNVSPNNNLPIQLGITSP